MTARTSRYIHSLRQQDRQRLQYHEKEVGQPLENLRPGFFLDALVVRGLEPDDLYGVVADSETVEDAARKHLFTVPEYMLSISRRKPGSQQLTPVRVMTFRRDDLLPYAAGYLRQRWQPGDPGRLRGLPGFRFRQVSLHGHHQAPAGGGPDRSDRRERDGEHDADRRPVPAQDPRRNADSESGVAGQACAAPPPTATKSGRTIALPRPAAGVRRQKRFRLC